MSKYSYILIGDDRGRNVLRNSGRLMLAGLYLWSFAFDKYGAGGTIDTFWRADDLDYDIVHINYTPSNVQLPTVVREELGDSSSTKLVINVDVDLRFWGANWSYNIINMIKELKLADVIFHVEPHGAQVLEHLLGRKVHVCPHPVDVSSLYDYIEKEREPMIATIFHRYTADILPAFIAQKDVPLRRVLFGYTPVGRQSAVANAGMFDQILPYQPYEAHIQELCKSAFGCDLYSGYSYGRSVVEFAALGIPAVVSSTIAASKRLFPYTTVRPFDTRTAERRFKELLQNEDMCDDVISTAHSTCKYYSLENSYRRFVEMIENEKNGK